MLEEYSRCYVSVNSNGNARLYNNRYMTTFGARVRERRLELGMKQPELAKAAGIKQPTVSNIEGDRNKGSSHVAQLAVALKCSAHWLATGKGGKEPGAAPTREQLTARQEILLYLFSGLVPEQQRAFIERMKAAFESNRTIRRHLGEKQLRFVSNAQIETLFGSVASFRKAQKKSSAKREPGTAMDDFLGEPE